MSHANQYVSTLHKNPGGPYRRFKKKRWLEWTFLVTIFGIHWNFFKIWDFFLVNYSWKKKFIKKVPKKKKKCPNTIGQIPERSSKISKEGPKISKEVLKENRVKKIGQNDQKKLIFSQFSLEIFGLSLEFLGPSLGILELLSGICPIVFGHFFFFWDHL